MKKRFLLIMFFAALAQITYSQDRLTGILKSEVNRNFAFLKEQPVPAYYISYRVMDSKSYQIVAFFGSPFIIDLSSSRFCNVDVRAGSCEVDNTKKLKDGINRTIRRQILLPQENNEAAIARVLWKITDEDYKEAVKSFENVKANIAVKVASEDQSDDFSQELREVYIDPPLKQFKDIKFDSIEWKKKISKVSAVFSGNKDIYEGYAAINVETVRKYFVDAEGAEIAENRYEFNILLQASTVADDGMELPLYKQYYAFDVKDLPSEDVMIKDAEEMSRMISLLRKAPVAEAYSGPALMTAEAAGVFFHEIFGHRVEGARMKQESDAQTFKKKINEQVLPVDISIIFDPTLKKYKGVPLRGNYTFDDEGVRGQRVEVIKNGILKSFLMSRTPIDGFPKSNGHGRAEVFFNNVTRQSNMIIESSAPKTGAELRALLVEQVKKENKEYGYLFDKVQGGFTKIDRFEPNAFNVDLLAVYKIYADGRPDELVRGVDLLGTPLSVFSQVAACGDDHGAFNGFCGAESGQIPVSCVSPTLYIKMIETQRKAKSQNQPPILEKP